MRKRIEVRFMKLIIIYGSVELSPLILVGSELRIYLRVEVRIRASKNVPQALSGSVRDGTKKLLVIGELSIRDILVLSKG